MSSLLPASAITIPADPFCRSSLTHFLATCSDSSEVMSYTTWARGRAIN